MNLMEKDNKAIDFLQQLKDKAFRQKIGSSLLEIEEGDWTKVVEVAQKYGFDFSEAELISIVPEGFFKGKGDHPERGWDESTRNLA